jgi:hypothetical protein
VNACTLGRGSEGQLGIGETFPSGDGYVSDCEQTLSKDACEKLVAEQWQEKSLAWDVSYRPWWLITCEADGKQMH